MFGGFDAAGNLYFGEILYTNKRNDTMVILTRAGNEKVVSLSSLTISRKF